MVGHRPSDWHVLDLDKDPTPGDPQRVRTLARVLHGFADDVSEALRLVKGMAGEGALAEWAGKSAEVFKEEFSGVPKNLRKLEKSYALCGDALADYWPKLERAQALADRALAKAREARADLSSAQSKLTSAESWVGRATKEADKYKDDPTGSKSDADQPDEAKVRAATRDVRSARSAQDRAQSDVSAAQGALAAAKKMAADARAMREEAARDAKSKIDEASDASIRNRSWWEEIGDWVTDNWDTIVAACKIVVAVVGIVALIIGGPILGAIVLIAALVVLADTLYKYSKGQASLWDVGLAALDCIPGMKGLTTLGGLAKGLRAMGGGGLKGMALAVRGLGKSARSMADGARGAYNRVRTVVRGCGDPVDVATGAMYLDQTDVELPGVLPLSFTRRCSSQYRAGWWFGPTWSSTIDQRLEVDEHGVVFVTEEGLLLAYPPLPGGHRHPVMPVSGPRRPLTRLTDGGYRIDDPTTGHSRHFAPPSADGVALITRVTDRNGNTITFDHDECGVPLAVRHSAGYHLELATDENRVIALRLVSDTRPTTIRHFSYTDGNLTAVTRSSGSSTRFTYDERLRVTSWTDSNGSSYAYRYDTQDRCVRQEGQAGHLSGTFAYDVTDAEWPGHRITTYTTTRGATSRFVVNRHCQIVAETDPLGATTRTEYDEHHHVLKWTDARGGTTSFENNEMGQPLVVTRVDGAVVRYVYGETGRPTLITLANGASLRYEYDIRGNRTAAVDPAGGVTRFSYDDTGRLTAVRDESGRVTTVRCDAVGLPIAVTDPAGGTVGYERDAFGRPVAYTDPLGAVTRFEWTAEGELSCRTAADGAVETWEYDGEGNCIAHTGPTGLTTRYEYTHFDLLAARVDASGARYEFTHDADLRLAGVTGPQGLTWTYTYDLAGRLVGETDFDGRTLSYVLDEGGRLVESVNDLGQRIRYEYDESGRVIRKDAHGQVTSFVYDPVGQLVEAIGPHACLTRSWDAAGRLIDETVNGRSTTHAYDDSGRRMRRTTPIGHVTRWAYDAAGLPSELIAADRGILFQRDRAGREVARRIAGSVVAEQVFDELGRLTVQSVIGADGHRVQRRAYTYRADGNLIGLDDQLDGGRRFELDDACRVTTVRAESWTERYAYDDTGNQLSASWPSTFPGQEAVGARAYTGTRLTRAGSVRYEYDTLGRVVLRRKTRLSRKPDTWRYEWDVEDRLTAVTTPDGTRWLYEYDPLGRRIAKKRLGPDGQGVVERVDFTWDGTTLCEQTSAVLDGTHAITLTWDHDGSRPAAQTERMTSVDTPQQEIDRRFFAIVTDFVGSPRELVDEQGSISWRVRTTLWGTTVWNKTATAYTPLRFPGQYYDPETSLHYNYFRHYDPEVARYITPDPLGLLPAPNPSTYVHNPLRWADPHGLAPCITAWKHSRDVQAAGGYNNPAARAYQIRHCGPTEYRATGGGEVVWADGIDSNTAELLDAKHVGKPKASPFIPTSGMPPFIRDKIVADLDDEFRRYGAVINDPNTPVTGLRVITNHSDAVPFFQGLMQQHGVPGRVVVAP
ncbi:DUF6531 domain-containing protein [Streptomyces sp. NPDC000348]|uniref:DUF6531 domain-containing protein n=1 Tax=Streptomyces sp. NPDC000348 TaxID=3364538 RepID=UPI00369EB98E